jgi:phosphate/sulfate permease
MEMMLKKGPDLDRVFHPLTGIIYMGVVAAAMLFVAYSIYDIALGLGTMVGWKRIVVTVGEKIGKTHLTYAQGACAEITAAATIAAAGGYGLPASTTHVLSSSIAGSMAANGSGLQWSTIRNIAMAWVLTLPIAMALSARSTSSSRICSEGTRATLHNEKPAPTARAFLFQRGT